MTSIHVSTGGQQRAVYSEEELRRAWSEGAFTESALYWQEGMPDWRPLREFFAVPSNIEPEEQPRYSFVRDPESLTIFVTRMLWIDLTLCVAQIFSDLARLGMTHQGITAPETITANDARQAMLALLSSFAFLITAFVFLRWIYFANVNARGFGAAGMRFTPGWAIAYYFIPILWLFRPYQVMKEIWQVSLNPRSWQLQPVTSILAWWWTISLLWGVSGQFTFQLARGPKNPTTLEYATYASLANAAIEALLCYVAVQMITVIYERQRALVEPAGSTGPTALDDDLAE